MRDPDTVRYELEAAKQRLAELPSHAYQRRIDARERIRDLETELAEASRPSAEVLRHELAELEARFDELADARIRASFASGGIAGDGVDPDFLSDANRKIDFETGIERVEQRIREIRRLLDPNET